MRAEHSRLEDSTRLLLDELREAKTGLAATIAEAKTITTTANTNTTDPFVRLSAFTPLAKKVAQHASSPLLKPHAAAILQPAVDCLTNLTPEQYLTLMANLAQLSTTPPDCFKAHMEFEWEPIRDTLATIAEDTQEQLTINTTLDDTIETLQARADATDTNTKDLQDRATRHSKKINNLAGWMKIPFPTGTKTKAGMIPYLEVCTKLAAVPTPPPTDVAA